MLLIYRRIKISIDVDNGFEPIYQVISGKRENYSSIKRKKAKRKKGQFNFGKLTLIEKGRQLAGI